MLGKVHVRAMLDQRLSGIQPSVEGRGKERTLPTAALGINGRSSFYEPLDGFASSMLCSKVEGGASVGCTMVDVSTFGDEHADERSVALLGCGKERCGALGADREKGQPGKGV